MAALLQVGALLCVATFIGLMALVTFLVHLDQRKLRRVAESTPCAQCGAILGEAALELGDELWRKHMSTLMARNPGVRFRIVRTLFAVCPKCGARYRFDEKSAVFDARHGSRSRSRSRDVGAAANLAPNG